jgi:hypothetical protein
MPAFRWTLALAAALAAAFSFPGLARADTACDTAGYAYAGVRTAKAVRGIRAVVTPLEVPQTASGPVTASLAVGRATVAGKRGMLRAGLLAAPGEQNRLYYEILTAAGWQVYVGRYVEPGVHHRVAIVEMAGYPGKWRVWFDGRPATRGIRLTSGRFGRAAVAAADTALDGSGQCSDFRYRFARVAVLRGGTWRQSVPTRVIADPGFAVLRSDKRHSFVAHGKADPPPASAPEPAPEPAPAPAPDPDPAPEPAPPRTEDFVGDWETGDWQQWSAIQWRTGGNLADQFAVVSDPLRQGAFAARFTVRPGDKFSTTSGERTEVLWLGSDEGEGEEYWYAWSTLFPTNWTEPYGWGFFVQWHSQFPIPPPLSFNARADTAEVSVNAGPLESSGTNGSFRRKYPLLSTLNKGRWNDFVARIRWSATNGAITVWHRVGDGASYVKRVDVTGIPTLQKSGTTISDNYLKLGLYRGADSDTNVVYHDDFRRWPASAPPSFPGVG